MPLRKTAAIAAFPLLLSGCAALLAQDCAGDAYEIGRRDGRIGAYAQSERYRERCGAGFDAARYTEGWRQGLYDRPLPPR